MKRLLTNKNKLEALKKILSNLLTNKGEVEKLIENCKKSYQDIKETLDKERGEDEEEKKKNE